MGSPESNHVAVGKWWFRGIRFAAYEGERRCFYTIPFFSGFIFWARGSHIILLIFSCLGQFFTGTIFSFLFFIIFLIGGSFVFFIQPTPLLFQSHFHTCPPKHSNKMRKEVSFLLWQLLFSPFHSSPLCSLSHHFHPFQLLKIL